MRFVDLFAGLGGFHLALAELGHECVFACEKNSSLRELYRANFGIEPHSDIRALNQRDVPPHEILCAGFPCQPFSKAGEQEGFACPDNGDLFEHVMRIAAYHKPKYLLLENVANLKKHNGGATWSSMETALRAVGYSIESAKLSPHRYGIPQIRERLFIVAARGNLAEFRWPAPDSVTETSIEAVLEKHPVDARQLSNRVSHCLDTWQQFLDAMPADVELPGCPLWTMEFGATYPYEYQTPWTARSSISRYRGSFGIRLAGTDWQRAMSLLPSHARVRQPQFPDWKIGFVRRNREFYTANRSWIDPWLPRITQFPSSLQKLEWNCRGEVRDIWQYVVQFRASGVRVKRRTTSPSLIAMTTTQVPIIAWESRYMSPRECSRLQSMDALKYLPKSDAAAYSALGNGVNVRVVKLVARALFESSGDSNSFMPRVGPTTGDGFASTRQHSTGSQRTLGLEASKL
ncbi:MAG: DNA (cytosine-5-)-methyltransferase [Chthoniobacterales bacterium]|nr:DNA (cytosine-5-)-methyltransferase [Chthoniobacterales bacterium]